MEPVSLLPTGLAEVLARGGFVVTGNQRAARTLRLAYDRQKRAEGARLWQPPKVFAWATWTGSLYQRLMLTSEAATAPRLLLNATQELQLWRSIIGSDPHTSSLESASALAGMAAEAWRLLCQYRGQAQLKSLGVTSDTKAFQRWAQAFVRRCTADGYLSPAELEAALASGMAGGTFEPGLAEVRVAGFDALTPAQTMLLDALREDGTVVTTEAPSARADVIRLIAAPTIDDELAQAAQAIRATLIAEPGLRVAVIHPDIAAERAEINRIFRHILAPELESILANAAAAPYEFSLGEPLLQHPMVMIAMKLLHWLVSPMAINEITRITLSPYFALDGGERDARAEFDAFELRQSRLLRPELSLQQFTQLVAASKRREAVRGLLSQVQSLQRTAAQMVLTSAPAQKTFADWADTIRALLQAAGWSAGALDSVEFQALRKWESALDEVATLDFEGTRASFGELLSALEDVLGRTLFAPESREAPVQIMSPLEAAGSRFDAIYFLRASDLSWPTRPGANPLLGWRLQRELAMPGSDPVRDFEQARAITERLVASAAAITFSYAVETAEHHQRPSPLLGHLSVEQAGAVDQVGGAVALEVLDDPGFIPLADLTVRGGTEILKLQAACGFRAFAERRLNAQPLKVPEAGLDALESGNIVHVVMAEFWRELRSHAALMALSEQQRSEHLEQAITAALERTAQTAAAAWETAYVEVQRARLRSLLKPWIELEARRKPFTVTSIEESLPGQTIGPLTLSVRVDRIDTVTAEGDVPGGRIILDYKTGDAKPAQWLSERPDEPQLPLYAVLSDPATLAAIGFARLRAGKEIGLHGFAEEPGLLEKQGKHGFESLEVLVEEWRRVLTTLAEEFAAGDARVRPKLYPGTCAFCRQRILCRVDPALFEDLDPDAEVAGVEDGADG